MPMAPGGRPPLDLMPPRRCESGWGWTGFEMTRVALTTTSDQAAAAARSLLEAGHKPVQLPCIEVRPANLGQIDEIRHLADSSDVILITSARAVRAVWDDEPMPQTPVVTVGDASAAAVRQSGGVVTFAGSGDLAGVLDSVQLDNQTILYPCSSLTDHKTRQDQIEAVGGKPVIITAYDVTPI
ncbi:MAG: hypothetical protein GEU79_08330, partial [Acidimicrobiia bacterium]|nr:hypothetical protein [Acidimicrobiia bacterium]